jgi:hypothetical protein
MVPTRQARDLHAEACLKLCPQVKGAGVRVNRPEQHGFAIGAFDIGGVDAGIGGDMAQPVPGNDHARSGAHDGRRFPQDQLRHGGMLAGGLGELQGCVRYRRGSQSDRAAFDL